MLGLGVLLAHLIGDYIFQDDFQARYKVSNTAVCALHCTLYSVAFIVVLQPFYSMPWWFYLAVAALHFPVDRFRLARHLMAYNGQEDFATKQLSPWSIVVVDNTIHLAVAYVLVMLAAPVERTAWILVLATVPTIFAVYVVKLLISAIADFCIPDVEFSNLYKAECAERRKEQEILAEMELMLQEAMNSPMGILNTGGYSGDGKAGQDQRNDGAPVSAINEQQPAGPVPPAR